MDNHYHLLIETPEGNLLSGHAAKDFAGYVVFLKIMELF